MTQSIQASALPGRVRQVGYVVSDLDKTIETWLEMGIGPWYVLRKTLRHMVYRGESCDVVLSVGFANSGDLQIELIQQDDDTPSIFTEFLGSGPGGYHQLAWWTDDYDAAIRRADEAGWPIVWSGGENDGMRYAYFEPPSAPATVVEIMELTAASNALIALVRDAAVDWDGKDPIRSMNLEV
ncbi:VOC family protein [Mycobacterium sp.]|uniref:VOC family protein n=1 Tax=Mycobacterium sp. TaxID=1785 RepID=UPI003BAE7DAB